jgi:regulator of RNase E activity RraA
MMMEIDTLVECGGVRVCPGDWIFGDVDGVVVIPSILTKEVIARSLEKVRTESKARQELERGDLLAEVFARHKVL